MKKTLFIAISIILITSSQALAQKNPFGLGLIIGEPTGLSLKYFITDESAIDFALAWSFSGDDAIHIHGDYLLHNYGLISVSKGQLPLYYGIGGRLKMREDDDDKKGKDDDKKNIFGIRIPVGLAYIFDDITLDVFVEVVPVVNIVPDTDFDLEAAIGVRYFF